MLNWFNRQQCQSFSKAESGSASSAIAAEILKYCMLPFFPYFKDHSAKLGMKAHLQQVP